MVTEETMLSGNQLKRLVPESRVFLHSSLRHATDIEQLFVDAPLPNVCFILYETGGNEGLVHGHWCLLIDRGERGFLSFDSYGGSLEQQYKYIVKNYRTEPYLIKLLLKSQRPVEVNRTRYQQREEGINTCGCHCVMRAYCEGLGNKEYKDKVLKLCGEGGITPDELSVQFINGILNGVIPVINS
jgi:hypothetical protein